MNKMNHHINAKFNSHGVLLCPVCEQHELSVDHIGWDESGNAICPICSTNWLIEHVSPPPLVQRMSGDWVLTEQPQDFVAGKVLLRHSQFGFVILVDECLQGKDPKEHFTHLYDEGTVPLKDILGLEFAWDLAELVPGGHGFRYVAFKSNDEIRQQFGWSWKEFSEAYPLDTPVLKKIFPEHFA